MCVGSHLPVLPDKADTNATVASVKRVGSGRKWLDSVGSNWNSSRLQSQQILKRLFTDPIDSHPNSNLRKIYVGISGFFFKNIVFFLFVQNIKSKASTCPMSPMSAPSHGDATRGLAGRTACTACTARAPGPGRFVVSGKRERNEKRSENQTCNIH